jgi:amino acid transporter
MGGWLYAGGFAIGISFVLVISSYFFSVAMTAHTSVHLSWYQWLFPLLALLAVLGLLDVRVSMRVQLVVAAAGVIAILVLAIAIAAQGGASGLSAEPLDPARAPSASGLFLAVVFGFTGFIGFEAAAALGEEARRPLTAIPRAVLAAVLIALVFYVFVTWAMAVGFGPDHAGTWAGDPAALDTLATRYVGDWLAIVIDFAVAASGFVGALAVLQLTARTLYAMARDGALPRVFAWTHPRTRTPWAGIAAVLVLTLVLSAVLARHYGPITYFALIATTATLAILATYVLVAASGVVYFLREGRGGIAARALLDVVLPTGAIAICGYTIYKSIVPRPAHPVDLAPYIAAGWLALGLVIVIALNLRSPDRVSAFGSTLGLEAPGVGDRQAHPTLTH